MSMIVSTHSFRGGTGKSNLTANITALLAQQGLRVGVVDTDIQSPGIHVLFGLDETRMVHSLNDYLWGKCSIEETAHNVTPTLGKDIRGCVYLVPSSIKAGEIARGSTLMNITQQVAASMRGSMALVENGQLPARESIPQAILSMPGIDALLTAGGRSERLDALVAAAERRGLVVNVTSDAAQGAYPGWGPYGASKAAADLLLAGMGLWLLGGSIGLGLRAAMLVPPEKKIAAGFERDLTGLKQRCTALGGSEAEGNVRADYVSRFDLLPCVRLYLSFWVADEEFDADCKLLFDSSAKENLDIGYLAHLVERFAGELVAG